MNNLLILLCIILWGVSTFLNRLAADKMPPMLMQIIVGLVCLAYIPIALMISGVGNPFTYKWNGQGLILVIASSICNIIAYVALYSSLKGSSHTGTAMSLTTGYVFITLVLSMIFLNEQITTMKAIGMIAMVGGAIILGTH